MCTRIAGKKRQIKAAQLAKNQAGQVETDAEPEPTAQT